MMRSAIQRISRVSGVKNVAASVSRSVNLTASKRQFSIYAPPMGAPTTYTRIGCFQTALPRVEHDDLPIHALCTSDVLADRRYGLTGTAYEIARNWDESTQEAASTVSPVIADGTRFEIPRLANVLLFRHYATQVDALAGDVVMAATLRLFLLPAKDSSSTALEVKDIVLPLNAPISALNAEIRACWLAPNGSRVPDSADGLPHACSDKVPRIAFVTEDRSALGGDTPIAAMFKTDHVEMTINYPSSVIPNAEANITHYGTPRGGVRYGATDRLALSTALGANYLPEQSFQPFLPEDVAAAGPDGTHSPEARTLSVAARAALLVLAVGIVGGVFVPEGVKGLSPTADPRLVKHQ